MHAQPLAREVARFAERLNEEPGDESGAARSMPATWDALDAVVLAALPLGDTVLGLVTVETFVGADLIHSGGGSGFLPIVSRRGPDGRWRIVSVIPTRRPES